MRRKPTIRRSLLSSVSVCVLACAAVLAPLIAVISLPASSGATTGSFTQGAYPAYDSSSPCSLLNSFSNPTGTNATLGTGYIQAGNGWPGMDGDPNGIDGTSSLTQFSDWQTPCANGPSPLGLTLAVPIIPKYLGSAVITLAQGANSFSSYAQNFRDLTDNLVLYANTTNAILRLGWEFDGTKTYSWIAQDPENELYYAEYFADIVNTMESQETYICTHPSQFNNLCPHYQFVWDPNWFAFFGLYHSDNGVTDNDDVYPKGSKTTISYNEGCGAYPEPNASTDTSQLDSCLLYAWPGSLIQSANLPDVFVGQDNYDDQGWTPGVPATYANYIAPALSEEEEFSSLNGNMPIVFPEWGVCQKISGFAATSDCQGDDPTYIENMYNFMASPTNPNNPSDVVPVAWESYFNDNQTGWNSAITASYFANSKACFTSEFASGSSSGC